MTVQEARAQGRIAMACRRAAYELGDQNEFGCSCAEWAQNLADHLEKNARTEWRAARTDEAKVIRLPVEYAPAADAEPSEPTEEGKA